MLKDPRLGRRGFLQLLGAGFATGVGATATACSSVFSDTEFIIIGAGAGGGPLAANLARNGHKVLLIDAGDDYGESLNYQEPARANLAAEDPHTLWAYYIKHYSEPARMAESPLAVMVNGEPRQYYPRASTLGGCTAHNQLYTVYPYNDDWDRVASITGDPSWGRDNMRRLFTLMENCEYLPRGTPGHGFDGWFHTSLVDPLATLGDIYNNISTVLQDNGPTLKCVLSAAIALGEIGGDDPTLPQRLFTSGAEVGGPALAALEQASTELYGLLRRDMNSVDPNRDSTQGVFTTPQSARQGRRNSARDYVVATATDFPSNLQIWTNRLVTRILFDGQKAVGIQYIDASHVYGADTNPIQNPQNLPRHLLMAPSNLPNLREIILCAGAYNTPQLLKLSGIGAKDELAQFGIPVVVDLPGVGENLHDGLEIPVVSSAQVPISAPVCDTSIPDPCLTEFESGIGPDVFSTLATVYIRSTPEQEFRDAGIFGSRGNFHGWYPGYSVLRQEASTNNHFSWYIIKKRVQNGAGTVKLATGNPWDPPDINTHSFDEGTIAGGAADNDLRACVESVKFVRKMNAIASQMIDGGLAEVIPGPLVQTDEDIAQFVKRWACGHHCSATCKIGSDTDPLAVLDSNFNVRGTQGLRVVDASAFPFGIGFVPQVPVYLLSEKAFDVILATMGEKRNGNASWSWSPANP